MEATAGVLKEAVVITFKVTVYIWKGEEDSSSSEIEGKAAKLKIHLKSF